MPQIPRTEYDASYFDGALQTIRHNAGYSRYYDNKANGQIVFEWLATDVLNRYTVGNKKVLVVGCAKGILVEQLRNRGVDAYGVDWSSYAISEAIARNPDLAPYLTEADIMTEVLNYRNNEWQLLITRDTLSCFEDSEITTLVTEFNRVSRDQFHKIHRDINPTFYNAKTLQEWLAYDWNQGTILTNATNPEEIVIGENLFVK